MKRHRKRNRRLAPGAANLAGKPRLDAKTRERALRGATVDPIEHRAVKGPNCELVIESLADAGGIGGARYRTVDTLAQLRRNGTITVEHEAAGQRFEEDFAAAGLQRLRAAGLERLDRGTAEESDLIVESRRRVWLAIDCLGGIAAPATGVVWGVLGEGRTISEYASTATISGLKSIHREFARGILIAALHSLAMHYRLGRRIGRRGSQTGKSGQEKT